MSPACLESQGCQFDPSCMRTFPMNKYGIWLISGNKKVSHRFLGLTHTTLHSTRNWAPLNSFMPNSEFGVQASSSNSFPGS